MTLHAIDEVVPMPIHVNAVAIDETRHYRIAPEDKPFIKAIKCVYIYNADERTFCCEITPSRFLEYIYTVVDYTDDVLDDDSLREHLDERYAFHPTEDFYMHCSSVERLHPVVCGEHEYFEEAREHLQGNWPI